MSDSENSVTSETSWIVEVHDSFEPIMKEWRALACPENSTPFQTCALMNALYRQLAENGIAEPVMILVRFADGRPAALLAMLKARINGLVWLHTNARPIDYGAPIFDISIGPKQARSIIRAALGAVPGVDLAYFNKMPAHFSGTPNPLLALPNTGRLRLSAWGLQLAGRTIEQVRALQHSGFRTNLRRRTRKLAREYDRQFSISLGTEISDEDFAAFREMRTQSTSEKGRSDILKDENWAGFYIDLLNHDTGRCRPFLSKLSADGEIIAMLFGFSDGDRVVGVLPAAKMGKWKCFGPGIQLFYETIAHFHALDAKFFDLSIGDMAYKIRFGCDQLPLHDAMFPKTLAGHLYYLFWRVKIAIRSRMKPLDPH